MTGVTSGLTFIERQVNWLGHLVRMMFDQIQIRVYNLKKKNLNIESEEDQELDRLTCEGIWKIHEYDTTKVLHVILKWKYKLCPSRLNSSCWLQPEASSQAGKRRDLHWEFACTCSLDVWNGWHTCVSTWPECYFVVCEMHVLVSENIVWNVCTCQWKHDTVHMQEGDHVTNGYHVCLPTQWSGF